MTKKELKELIFEAYVEALRKQSEVLLTEDEDKDASMVFGGSEGATLPDSTDQILAKFPTLKHALIRLHSDDFKDFVSGIDWISPRPTVFRVNLSNGQNYTLKWMGKDFEATIMGKPYYLGTLVDFQRALGKMVLLYQEGPMGLGGDEEGDSGGDSGFGGSGGGGGSFPGGDSGFDSSEELPADGADEEGDSEGEDLKDEPVDFEADADI